MLTKESINNYITACLLTLLKAFGGGLGEALYLVVLQLMNLLRIQGAKGEALYLVVLQLMNLLRVQGAEGEANEVLPAKQYCLSRLAVVGLLVRFWCDCHNSKP